MAGYCRYAPWLAAALIVVMVSGCPARVRDRTESKTAITGSPTSPTKEHLDFPEFPWPPPQASAKVVIPDKFLRNAAGDTPPVGEVEKKIRDALDANGYAERSYYAVPEGFALVTRLEQILEDGRSKEAPERWATDIRPLRQFSLDAYLKALFTSNPGYYRVIVFIVTPNRFENSEQEVSRDEAMKWLRKGLAELPEDVGAGQYSRGYVCTALIYEFEQAARGSPAKQRVPSRLGAKDHLEMARIWEKFIK
jgi:hypothetical protein